MEGRERPRSDNQLTLYDEAALLARLSEQQERLVSRVLEQAARSTDVSAENARLSRDLAGSRDRLQEVHHRIRNHLQTVTGLLSAQGLTERSPSARSAVQKGVSRLAAIAAIHDLLARDPTSEELRLPDLAGQLARHLLHHAGAEERLRVHAEVSPLMLPAKEASAFVLILTELLCNAIEHAFPADGRGDIFIRITRSGEEALLEVRDTGCGLPADFDLERADSLGLRLVTRLAQRDLGGSVVASSTDGACFRVTFPLPGTKESGDEPEDIARGR